MWICERFASCNAVAAGHPVWYLQTKALVSSDNRHSAQRLPIWTKGARLPMVVVPLRRAYNPKSRGSTFGGSGETQLRDWVDAKDGVIRFDRFEIG